MHLVPHNYNPFVEKRKGILKKLGTQHHTTKPLPLSNPVLENLSMCSLLDSITILLLSLTEQRVCLYVTRSQQ